MGRVTITGGTFAGVAAAVRLARVGHDVTLVAQPGWASSLSAELDDTLDFPAPWRDLLKKSGRPAVGALGLRGLELVADGNGPATDRGAVWYSDVALLGESSACAWRELVDAAEEIWQTLRPLGVEAELTPRAVARSGLHPHTSLGDLMTALPHPVLRDRLASLAASQGLEPDAAPGWLASRLAVARTFGRWRLRDSSGESARTSALVSVLIDRLAERGVVVSTDDPGDGEAHVDTIDPDLRWYRPRRWHRHDTFVDQLLARPRLRTPGRPGHYHASASSPAGREPWAQLLTGALAAYAVHEQLTGEDIRPTHRDQPPGHGVQ